jgi:hypothetical protein
VIFGEDHKRQINEQQEEQATVMAGELLIPLATAERTAFDGWETRASRRRTGERAVCTDADEGAASASAASRAEVRVPGSVRPLTVLNRFATAARRHGRTPVYERRRPLSTRFDIFGLVNVSLPAQKDPTARRRDRRLAAQLGVNVGRKLSDLSIRFVSSICHFPRDDGCGGESRCGAVSCGLCTQQAIDGGAV